MMYGADHFRIECSCGAVIEQCVCDGPGSTHVTIRPKGCAACQTPHLAAFQRSRGAIHRSVVEDLRRARS